MPTEKLTKGQYKVAATGFLSLFSIVGIMFYGLPFFFDFWVKDFGWTRATVTSGNVFGKVIIGPLFGFAAGWIVDRFGPKRLMLFGIFICGMAVIGLSKMNSLFEFYALYMLMALGYMCGGPLPNQVLTSRWFNKSRGKAMGFAYLGIGIGGMLVPQIARWLNKQMDWRSSLVMLGSLMILVALPMALFVKENPADKTTEDKLNNPAIPFSSILKNRSFYFLALGSMCSIGAVAGVSQNLKLFFSLDLKYSQSEAANVISLVLGASIIGRLLMGWLADRYSKKYVMMLIYTLISLSIVLLFFVQTPGVIYLFALIFGIGLGGDYMIIPLMAAELFGIKVMGRVMGLVLTVDGLAEAFGPVLAGWLRDRNGSYAIGFSALILLSVIGTFAVWMLPAKKTLQ
ncbi:MFS transporter [Flavihumibacter fluvii]|uniref:MFS transporter n=1 Tax=Flavihumibacter fluvii TaxID=2838157 RepID=UPI001BDEECC1|nr:MFS transporter [Flavihumibacter fluvii]ULQ54608.1 MFS transporter [Flavihumibacter fluvii]